jgi:hypothetical protein
MSAVCVSSMLPVPITPTSVDVELHGITTR